MAGMRATLGDVSGLIGTLDDDEWAPANAAAGWTVKDVVTHFGDLLGIPASPIGSVWRAVGRGLEGARLEMAAGGSAWLPPAGRIAVMRWGT
jgi:hypothetical protein